MIHINRSTTPEIHDAAQRIAKRLAGIISSILRDEERIEFTRVAYAVAREELESFKGAK